MIIVCPKCSTKFKVKADRIPAAGANVRCARCKHVFHVDNSTEDVSVPVVEETAVQQSIERRAAEDTEAPAPVGDNEATATEDAFSYDRFRELDPAAEEDDSSFTFSSEEDAETETAASGDTLPEEDFSFSGGFDTDDQNGAAGEEQGAAGEESPRAAVMEEEAGKTATKKSGPLAAIIRILLLLILGLLVAGGVLVYMNGPEQLNRTIQQILGQQQDQKVQTGRISLAELEGKFIQNYQAGELFLIRGKAVNDYPEPRAAIQVKGVIFDPNGKPLLQKTVFCGNPIPDKDLQALSFPELEKIMGNQFGTKLSNMKVAPGQAIPFDIVFKDLPQNLSEFSVKVTASKPASE